MFRLLLENTGLSGNRLIAGQAKTSPQTAVVTLIRFCCVCFRFRVCGWLMTHRFDVAHDPAVAARWCTLAEQRLEYLTELFQNGRWRRYYSHTAFIENIKEAKAMVAHWRALSTPGHVPEEPTPIVIPEPKPESVSDVLEPAPDEIDLDAANEVAPADEAALADEVTAADEVAAVDETAAVPVPEVPAEMPSTPDHMKDRYSLLRNLTL
jgi:uncharacterized repeat protein (TIGR03809 family)